MNRTISVRLATAVLLGMALLPTSRGVEAATGLSATTVRGANFLIKSQNDQFYCIEADSGMGEGRSLTLQGCSIAETQRWALTWYTTELNQVVDSQGMCLNVRDRRADDGLNLDISGCRADRAEFFTYTSAGLLQSARGCLGISGTAANAPIKLVTCDPTKPTHRWVVTHPSA